MECPNCGAEAQDGSPECLRCGIIFSKFKKNKPEYTPYEYIEAEGVWNRFFFFVPDSTDSVTFTVRVVFYVFFLIWGVRFIFTPLETNYSGESLWHLVNLPFHETGHIIFRPFGRVITSLGGSLAQLMLPLICMGVFLVKTKDTFAASFTLWWFGENFMDLAPYIDDARSLVLPLVGGNTGKTSPYGFHDWEFILTETGLIRYDHTIAWLSYKTGTIFMIISFAWGGYILYKMYKNLEK